MPPRRLKQEAAEATPELPFDRDSAYMDSEFITNIQDGEFVPPSRVEGYIERVRISIASESKDGLELEFDLVHVEAAIANALRRVLLAEVPTMAMEKIYLYQNTSCIPDEVLCHRIGLLPVLADPRLFLFPTQKFTPIAESDDVDEEPDGNPKEHILMNFHIRCSKKKDAPKDAKSPHELFVNHYARSSAFKWEPIGDQEEWLQNVRLVHDDVVVAKLRPGQEIEASCHCVKGIGQDHAKFSPVATASYRLLPDIALKRAYKGEEAKRLQACFTKGVIEVDEDESGEEVARVAYARGDMCSRNVLRHEDLRDHVELSKKKDHFIFNVESTGAMRSNELVVEACRVIRDKANNLHQLFLAEYAKVSATKV